VTAPVTAAVIDAVDDRGAPVNGYTGGTSFTNVLVNDTLNGVAVDPATLTLRVVSSTNGGVTLSARNVLVAAGTAAGNYSLVYEICELLNPTNCDTATVTVPVTAAPIDAVDDAGASVDGTAGGTSLANVLVNDTLNGVAVTPSAVAVTFVSSTSGGVTLSGSSVVVAAGTAASGATPYSLVYQICEVLNPTNCDTATVTVPVTVQTTPPPTQACVREADYWLTHPDQWPVSSLTLGSVAYSKAQLLRILGYAARSDVRMKSGLAILASDLIVARLNQAAGAPVPPSILAAMAAADRLIGSNVLPPIGQCSLSPIAANALDCLLAEYNKGETRGGPPSCRDCSSSKNDHSNDDYGKDDHGGKNSKDEKGGRGNNGGRDRRDGKDSRDDKDGRDDRWRDGDDDHSDVSCGPGPGGNSHHEGDSCVAGHHSHTDGDRCRGSEGVHHAGDGCDSRNASHSSGMKKWRDIN
jgi:hypothetical protein